MLGTAAGSSLPWPRVRQCRTQLQCARRRVYSAALALLAATGGQPWRGRQTSGMRLAWLGQSGSSSGGPQAVVQQPQPLGQARWRCVVCNHAPRLDVCWLLKGMARQAKCCANLGDRNETVTFRPLACWTPHGKRQQLGEGAMPAVHCSRGSRRGSRLLGLGRAARRWGDAESAHRRREPRWA